MAEVITTGQAGTKGLTPNPATARLVERRDMTEDLMVIKLEPSEQFNPASIARWDWARLNGPIP
jgi:hypothetical protein